VSRVRNFLSGRRLGSCLARSLSRWCFQAHRSVTELEADIRMWVNAWNKDPRPFVWTKTADEILETLAAYCQRISEAS
jgi:hypothetical protein